MSRSLFFINIILCTCYSIVGIIFTYPTIIDYIMIVTTLFFVTITILGTNEKYIFLWKNYHYCIYTISGLNVVLLISLVMKLPIIKMKIHSFYIFFIIIIFYLYAVCAITMIFLYLCLKGNKKSLKGYLSELHDNILLSKPYTIPINVIAGYESSNRVDIYKRDYDLFDFRILSLDFDEDSIVKIKNINELWLDYVPLQEIFFMTSKEKIDQFIDVISKQKFMMNRHNHILTTHKYFDYIKEKGLSYKISVIDLDPIEVKKAIGHIGELYFNNNCVDLFLSSSYKLYNKTCKEHSNHYPKEIQRMLSKVYEVDSFEAKCYVLIDIFDLTSKLYFIYFGSTGELKEYKLRNTNMLSLLNFVSKNSSTLKNNFKLNKKYEVSLLLNNDDISYLSRNDIIIESEKLGIIDFVRLYTFLRNRKRGHGSIREESYSLFEILFKILILVLDNLKIHTYPQIIVNENLVKLLDGDKEINVSDYIKARENNLYFKYDFFKKNSLFINYIDGDLVNPNILNLD